MKVMRFVLAAMLVGVAMTPNLCLARPPAPKAPPKTEMPKAAEDPTGITQAVAALNQYKSVQASVKIQNVDLAYAMRKAVVLAQLLIGPDGKLNFALCPAIKSAFVPQNPLKYEVNIGRVLGLLNASWQPFFDKITKPKDPTSLANNLLRGLFGLRSDEAVTDLHAKLAVLASLFAPYNQGSVGDCFAVADLIRDHEEYHKHSADDCAQLVQKGYITRTVGTVPDNFFFVAVLADDDASAAFALDASGKVQGSNVSLFDAPGFAAASNAMGGGQVPNLSQTVLNTLFNGNVSGQIQVSAQQVVAAAAQAISAVIPNGDAKVLFDNGMYAFSSLTNNPVLRATECIFSAMAEDRSQDFVRGNVNTSVEQALQSSWNSLRLNPQLAAFQKAFTTKLNASFRLIYNPSIPLAQVSADGSSSEGGFQLYKRSANVEQIGTRVATPQDFRQFVLDVVAAAEKSLGFSPQAHAISAQLSQFVKNDDFLKAVLWDYESSNKQEPDPITNYQNFARTPMQSCDGDNPYEVSDIDTGRTYDTDVITYTPKNTTDLLTWCLNLSKTAPKELIPMDSPQHAFNFDPTNSDIVAFIKSGKTADVWIRQMLKVPCMQVATRQIDSITQTVFSDAILSVVQEIVPDAYQYQALVANLAQKNLSVQKYAQGLLDGVKKLIQLDADQASQITRILDNVLISALSDSDRTILQNAAIRFAFTNWNDGTKDIYFCAFFNLRTLQIGFASIDEDKTNMSSMDEVEWVNNQQWDVDLRPYAPSNTLMAIGY